MKFSSLIQAAALTACLAATPVFAGGVAHHASQAGAQSVEVGVASGRGVGHSAVGTAKLASAVAAVPFVAAGYVGSASAAVGETLWDAAAGPAPLEVSPDTVTAGPAPDRVLVVDR